MFFLEFPCFLHNPANDPGVILSNKRCVFELGWPSSSSLQATDAGEHAEKRRLLHCWRKCSLMQPLWRTQWRFLKRGPTPEYVSGENHNMKAFMPPSVHSSTSYNSLDMEAASVSSVCVRAQLCPTVCDLMDCSPTESCPWNFPGENNGTGCHFLCQNAQRNR